MERRSSLGRVVSDMVVVEDNWTGVAPLNAV